MRSLGAARNVDLKFGSAGRKVGEGFPVLRMSAGSLSSGDRPPHCLPRGHGNRFPDLLPLFTLVVQLSDFTITQVTRGGFMFS